MNLFRPQQLFSLPEKAGFFEHGMYGMMNA